MREQILAETTRLMATRGFEGTTLQAIADAVGIRKASVLYHFSSKEALRDAVLEELLYRWNEVLPSMLLSAGDSGRARFEAVIGEMMRFFAAEPDRARLLLRELLDRPDEMARYASGYIKPWMDVVAGYLRRGQRAGSVRPHLDPEAYILQMTIASLAAIATADRCQGLLGDGEQGRQRTLDELIRVARVSLFADGAGELE